MSTRVSITCTDGDMFSFLSEVSLPGTIRDVDDALGYDGDGMSFEAFGRSRTITDQDVAEIRFKAVD